MACRPLPLANTANTRVPAVTPKLQMVGPLPLTISAVGIVGL